MPSPAIINLVPQGLLDLFSIRSGGRNPQYLNDQLLPQLDLSRWYYESKVLEVNMTGPVLAVTTGSSFLSIPSTGPVQLGNGVNIIVPSNEVWILLPGTRVSAVYSAHAGSDGRYALTGQRSGGVFDTWAQTFMGWPDSSGAYIRGHDMSLNDPQWLGPGDVLLVRNFGTAVAAGNVAIGGTLRLVRLRI